MYWCLSFFIGRIKLLLEEYLLKFIVNRDIVLEVLIIIFLCLVLKLSVFIVMGILVFV